MSDCCSSSSCSSSQASNKHICPANGKAYTKIPESTLYHHLKEPWLDAGHNTNQTFYFCDDPDCDVVYFGEDDSVITRSELRTKVAVKEPHNDDALICYCFGVSQKQARENPQAKAFVVEKTKQGLCACDTRNPSGRCCLKDFPKS